MDRRDYPPKQKQSPFYDLNQTGYKQPVRSDTIQIFAESLNREKPVRREPEETRSAQARAPRPRKRRSKRRYSGGNRSVALSVIMIYAVVGFSVASLMIARYSNIIKTDDELDAIEARIEELRAVVEEKRLEVSLKDDISMVQREAKNRLGMYYPKNDQIVYIELDDAAFEEPESLELTQGETGVQ